MLQRIQSIFLLLAMIANLSILFLPFWEFQSTDTTESLTALSISTPSESMSAFDQKNTSKLISHMAVLGLSVISGIMLLLTIFQFNDRMRQKRLAYMCIILTMLLLVAMVILTLFGPTLLMGSGSSPALGFFLPVASILLIWLAISRIQKDEDLVKSVDRIR